MLRVPLMPEGSSAAPALYEGIAKPQLVGRRRVFADRWGITKAQLRALIVECRRDPAWSEQFNMRDFVPKYIKPKTSRTGMGYSLLVNKKDPKRVNLMVSHCWDELAGQFFDDLLAEMRDNEVAFICAFALYQNDGEDPGLTIREQVGTTAIAESPFFRVIENIGCRHVRMGLQYRRKEWPWKIPCLFFVCKLLLFPLDVLVRCCYHLDWWFRRCVLRQTRGVCYREARRRWYASGRMIAVSCDALRGQGLYSRMWCAFEAGAAYRHFVPIDVVAKHKAREYLLPEAKSTQTARCGNPACPINEDERRIRASITSYKGVRTSPMEGGRMTSAAGYDWLDRVVRTYVLCEGNEYIMQEP